MDSSIDDPAEGELSPHFLLVLGCVAVGVPVVLLLSALAERLLEECGRLGKKKTCPPWKRIVLQIIKFIILIIAVPVTLSAILIALWVSAVLYTLLVLQILLLSATPFGVLFLLTVLLLVFPLFAGPAALGLSPAYMVIPSHYVPVGLFLMAVLLVRHPAAFVLMPLLAYFVIGLFGALVHY